MPQTLTKDAIRPGTYLKGGKVHTIDAAHSARWHANQQRLTELGYLVPTWMEHPDVTDRRGWPVKATSALRAEIEKDPWFAGWSNGMQVSPDGVVSPVIDVSSDDLATRLQSTGTFLSPQFGAWTDPDDPSIKFDSIISHYAMTRNPVNKQQAKRFSAVANATPEPLNNAQPVRFSYADLGVVAEQAGVVQFMQKYPWDDEDEDDEESPAPAQSVVDGQPPKDGDGDGVSGEAKPDNPGEGTTNPIANKPVDPKSSPNDGNQQGIMDAAPSAPADPLQQLMSHLKVIMQMAEMMAAAAQPNAAPAAPAAPQPMPNKPKTPGAGGPVSEEPLVISMSANTTPPAKTEAQRIAELESAVQLSNSTNQVLIGQVTDSHRKDYKARIGSAFKSGRLSTADRDRLLEAAGTYQFSVDAKPGTSALDIELGVVEKLPAGAVWTPEERTQQFAGDAAVYSPARSDPFFGNDGAEITDERSDEVANEVLGIRFSPGSNGQTTQVR